jgi:hypothetical protein
VLALSSKQTATPLFYISIYNSFRSKPDIILHNGATKAFPSLASVQFKGFSSTPHITLGSTRYGAAPTEALKSEGFFHVVHYFSLYLEDYGRRERFEWKSSGGAEVRALGHSTGMKLVRVKREKLLLLMRMSVVLGLRRERFAFLGRIWGMSGGLWLL